MKISPETFPRALLFDLDGTLTDSAPGILASFEYAWNSIGVSVPGDENRSSWIGPPLIETFTRVCRDDKLALEGVRAYREYYAEKGIFENRLYPGVIPMLEAIHALGIPLSLATSKPEYYASQILDHFNISRYFTAISGSSMDHDTVEKPEIIGIALERLGHPEPGQCVMTGDRIHDIEGARHHGMRSCAVLYGYGLAEELKRADCHASSPGEVLQCIERLRKVVANPGSD